jgi:hypothetical protein
MYLTHLAIHLQLSVCYSLLVYYICKMLSYHYITIRNLLSLSLTKSIHLQSYYFTLNKFIIFLIKIIFP